MYESMLPPEKVLKTHTGESALITQSWAVCAQTYENCIKASALCQSENVIGSITKLADP